MASSHTDIFYTQGSDYRIRDADEIICRPVRHSVVKSTKKNNEEYTSLSLELKIIINTFYVIL